MAQESREEKTIGEQMYELCEQKPENYDVTFCVGKEGKIVRAVKCVLKAASPVFEREFTDTWENAVIKKECIPLPELDPTAFQLFIKLIFEDKWSTEHIISLDLSSATLLNLLSLCRSYKITKAIKNLEIAAANIIRALHYKKDFENFFGISRFNLETVLACDELPVGELEIFNLTCRWAEIQCKHLDIEATEENYRKVLGGCAREIRFPTMTVEDISQVCNANTFLTSDERVAVHKFIELDEEARDAYDTTQLPFKTAKRITTDEILDMTKVIPSVTTMDVDCDGAESFCAFQSSKRICLKGIGFFAPISTDSDYEVTLQIKRYENDSYSNVTEIIQQRIHGRKGQNLYFLFDQEYVIEPSADFSWGKKFHSITYSLKGPAISIFDEMYPDQEYTFATSEFRFHGFNIKNICELIFKMI